MLSKKPVITVTAHSEDGPLQVEVAIPVRPRHRRPSLSPRIVPATEPPGPQRIPRVTRLMALAIKFQDMVDRGEVRDYADLARLGYVTRARITQIMNLLNLAPDIQEHLLLLPHPPAVPLPVGERHIRRVVSAVDWCEQRRRWSIERS